MTLKNDQLFFFFFTTREHNIGTYIVCSCFVPWKRTSEDPVRASKSYKILRSLLTVDVQAWGSLHPTLYGNYLLTHTCRPRANKYSNNWNTYSSLSIYYKILGSYNINTNDITKYEMLIILCYLLVVNCNIIELF